jgi:hypothetical protein
MEIVDLFFNLPIIWESAIKVHLILDVEVSCGGEIKLLERKVWIFWSVLEGWNNLNIDARGRWNLLPNHSSVQKNLAGSVGSS